MMLALENLTPPYSIAHFSGGIQVIFGSNNKANILPSRTKKKFGHFSFAKKSHVHSIAKQARLQFLALDEAITEKEVEHRGHNGFSIWPMGTPENAHIRHAAPFWRATSSSIDDSDMRVMADRVATQIEVSNIHFSNALTIYHYAAQNFLAEPNTFNQIVGDTYTARLAAEIQGILNDLYSLRDFMLAFYGESRFAKAPSTAKLAARIEQESHRTELDDLILKSLQKNGAISVLSNYRDLIAHVLPMLSARSSFHIVRSVALQQLVLPRVVFPIFDELLEAQTHVRGTKQLVEYELTSGYLKAVSENKNLVDALDFCHSAFAFLLDIGKRMAIEFRLEPYILTITDEDIETITNFEVVNGVKKLRLRIEQA